MVKDASDLNSSGRLLKVVEINESRCFFEVCKLYLSLKQNLCPASSIIYFHSAAFWLLTHTKIIKKSNYSGCEEMLSQFPSCLPDVKLPCFWSRIFFDAKDCFSLIGSFNKTYIRCPLKWKITQIKAFVKKCWNNSHLVSQMWNYHAWDQGLLWCKRLFQPDMQFLTEHTYAA